jgi:hypothetical protein
MNNSDDTYIERIPKFYPNGDIQITTLIKNRKNKVILDSIGELLLEIKPKLKIKKIELRNQRFKDLLVTSSVLKNDSILIKGYQ